jgi:hypothetical protein
VKWAWAVVLGGCATAQPLWTPPPPRTGDVLLRCDQPDALVLVDGVEQGRCEDFAAQGLKLRMGRHRVTVKKAGFLPYEFWCEPDGTRTSLDVVLTPSKGAS